MSSMTLSKSFTFEAAHRLPSVPESHKCRRLHGHSYQVDVIVKGDVNPDTGMIIDFAGIAEAWQPTYDILDHNYLNDIQGLENPTAEIIAAWIYKRMKPILPCLNAITVHETRTASARYEE